MYPPVWKAFMGPVAVKLTTSVTVNIVVTESPLDGSVALIVVVPALAAVAKPVVIPMLATAEVTIGV